MLFPGGFAGEKESPRDGELDVHGLFDGVGGERVRLTEDGLPERAENGKKKEDCYAAACEIFKFKL